VRSNAAAVAAAAAVLLASGCGGDGDATATTAATSVLKASAAETLFVQNCGACHALDAADTSGTFGGDLDELRPSRSAVSQAIEDGPATMPEAILTGRDADVVAGYVARVAGP
jgi:cytochrome c551